MTEINVTAVRIQVLFSAGEERILDFADIARAGEDPASISDEDLKTAVARFLDMPDTALSELKVRRPATGQILIAPTNRFGATNG